MTWATTKTKRPDKADIALEAINDLKNEFCSQPLFVNWKKGDVITLAFDTNEYDLPEDFGIPDKFVIELSTSWEYELEEAQDLRGAIVTDPFQSYPHKYFIENDKIFIGLSTPGQAFDLRPYYFKNIADYSSGLTVPLFVAKHGAKAYQYRAAAEIFEDIRLFNEAQYYARMAQIEKDRIIAKEMMNVSPVARFEVLF